MASTDSAALVEASLTKAIAMDPGLVTATYARLFATYPQFEEMFVMDVDGGVRASMYLTSRNCLLGVAKGDSDTPRDLIAAARMIHDGFGLSEDDVDIMFYVMRDQVRETLGAAWTDHLDSVWSTLLSELSSIGKSST